jgi:hypothetical protein
VQWPLSRLPAISITVWYRSVPCTVARIALGSACSTTTRPRQYTSLPRARTAGQKYRATRAVKEPLPLEADERLDMVLRSSAHSARRVKFARDK